MTKERQQIENHLLIDNKQRKTVKFHLNPVQAKYDEDRTNRDAILKARQEGISALILAYFLLDCLTTPNTKSVVVSHETEATQRLLHRVKMYIERFYNGDEFIKIKLQYNSKSELFFPETNSSFYIGTAGAKSFGRGDTINNLHLSEFAMFPNPQEFLAGIIPAVPDDGRIIIETTAKGFNYFKKLWEESKHGRTAFKHHFFAWWLNLEYAILGEPLELTEEEQDLQARFNLSVDQLRWRRRRISEIGEELFMQEFPADDFEAFLSSGRPVFNQQILKRYLARIQEPKDQGYINQQGQFTKNPKGYVRIWEWPEADESYVIGADVAEGLDHGDYSTGIVLSRNSYEVVASWYGHTDPDRFGDELTGLGMFYNYAVIGCERNNHGLATNLRMRDNKYKAIYRRQALDKITKNPISELGWRTDTKTRPIMLDDLIQATRDEQIGIPCEMILGELLSFERDEHGRMAAPEGMHDDLVIALAIANQMRKLTSPIDSRIARGEYPLGSAGRVFEKVLHQQKYPDVIGNG